MGRGGVHKDATRVKRGFAWRPHVKSLGFACAAGRLVKMPHLGGVSSKKMPPYEGVLSAKNPKKAETSATQAGKAVERGGKCREVKRRAGRGRNDSLVMSKASNTLTDLS